MDEWYLKSDGNEVGPFDLATMHRMVATKAIAPETLVRVGNGPWTVAASFPELGVIQFDKKVPPLLALLQEQAKRSKAFDDRVRKWKPSRKTVRLMSGISALVGVCLSGLTIITWLNLNYRHAKVGLLYIGVGGSIILFCIVLPFLFHQLGPPAEANDDQKDLGRRRSP